jgi:hypothetical protein
MSINPFDVSPENKELDEAIIESAPSVAAILEANERERQNLRQVLVDNGMGDVVSAVEEAVGVVNGFIGDVEPEAKVNIPTNHNAKIPDKPKEIIPATLDLKSEDDTIHDRLTEAMAGRLESDIPLTDAYWDIKNAYYTRYKG